MKNYYYNLLNSTEKQVYQILKQGIFTFQSHIAIPNYLAKSTDIPKVYVFVSCDYPKLFYVDFYDYHYTITANDTIIEPYYWYRPNQIAKMDVKIDKLLDKMASRVKAPTQYQTVQNLYQLLVSNVKYQKVSRVDRRKKINETNTIVGVLFYKKGMCEGIAKVFQAVANLVGINCIVALGFAGSSNEYHAWNVVEIDGATYQVDPTHALCEYSGDKVMCYDYLNLCDQDIGNTHKPRYPLPKCTATRHNYYVANNLVATKEADIRRIVENSTTKTIIFRYEGEFEGHVHKAAQCCADWIYYYHKRAKDVKYTYTPAYRICRVSYK